MSEPKMKDPLTCRSYSVQLGSRKHTSLLEVWARLMETDLHNILVLLGITVVADKRILSEEIEVFLRTSQDVQKQMRLTNPLPESRTLLWFEEHRADLSEFVQAQQFEQKFQGLLESLKHLADKDIILSAIEKIAKADGEFHVSEQALLALITSYWSR